MSGTAHTHSPPKKKASGRSRLPAKSKAALPQATQPPDLSDILQFIAADILPLRVMDLAGNILFKNPLYRAEIEPAAHEPDAPAIAEIIQQLESLHHPLEMDLRVNRGDKVYIYRTRHKLVQLSRDSAPVIVSSYSDISHEEQTRTRLQLTHNRLDDLVKLTSDWVWETDEDLRLTMTSQRVFEILGFHPRELAGCHLFSMGQVDPKHIDPVTKVPALVQRLAPFRDLDFQISGRDGSVHLLKLSGMPIFDSETGRFLGYRCTARDITEAVASQKQAKLLERRLSLAIENISEGFSLFDSNGKLLVINTVFKNFYPQTQHLLKPGIDKALWIRQAVMHGDVDIDGMIPEDWIETRIEHWQKARNPLEIKLADGRYLLIRDYKTDDGGRISIHSDITDIKMREQELVDARNSANQANKTKGEFFAKMSHELRTPLNAIIGFSDIMQKEALGPLGSEQYKNYAQDICESSLHLLQIINDILDVSKAEAGKLQLTEQNVSMSSAVQSSVRMLSEKAFQAGLKIDSQQVDGKLVLRGDQKKIRQILINLLSNAIKFTPHGGTVSVKTAVDQSGDAHLVVQDTGIGMRSEDIPKALMPFAQVDNSMSRKHDGTGLGLPLCVALAELHGGSLHIDSMPGLGTTIDITFPKSRVVESA